MKILTVIFLFAFFYIYAQTHRFIYEVQMKKDSTENLMTKQFYYLDINPDESIYYAKPYHVQDSIFAATGKLEFGVNKLTDIFRKDLKSQEYESFIMEGFDMYKIKSKEKQNWKILPQTKTVNNLKQQKAVSSWGGRNWIAWFSPEFPFQEGPYKFGGLPGLIVELKDDKNNFEFRLIRSENIADTHVVNFYTTSKSRAVEIPASKYLKIKLDSYDMPMKAAHNGTFDVTKTPLLTEYGTRVTNAKELRDYEDGERRFLKQYNNPIELDKAPHYPKD